ncbi:ATP-utilizing chromatin assembly and remodelling N-terminal-domain-containing protein [Radiomyces spectabilis]|uniref:ATP-utilizing chromatin assembly and remodelling N-terminal-domain-containing protein n=1 Tax=Radiomyces spectabilis TaxID=64574 RepID=UPI00221F2717|nr:ATP-utilizing chromatin assembly and remodelling N-terminal-domain-containing protein [Radiomyces spectabilis]KAI8373223.1 ATP-utilizing chromatin assembly and remodelling N-terminal-domain-containing protein [Radiomyces spectabilis]
MPLLKRKQFPLLPPPALDLDRKEARKRLAWYCRVTSEVFTDYPTYLQRYSLYKRPIWQCESTGRSNLTYAQALESERLEKERVQDKLSGQLQKRVLERVQFQTGRLDAVVDDVYNYFLERYVPGETVSCLWDDGINYTARILDIYPGSDETVVKEEDDGETEESAVGGRYRVQLIDEFSEGIEDCIKIVPKTELKRDRLAFSKNLLKKFIRECTTKDTYNGAPWVLKPEVAERFDLDTTLPSSLQEAKDLAYSKSRKRKAMATDQKPAKGTIPEEVKPVEVVIKYPIEDLDLPFYKTAMKQATLDDAKTSGSSFIPARPPTCRDSTIPKDFFGSFLMVWCFLSTFAKPLHLYPFNLDDFERAMRHNSMHIKSHILVESNVSLLNAIISQRHKSKTSGPSIASTSHTNLMYPPSRSATPATHDESAPPSQYASEDEHEDDKSAWTASNQMQGPDTVYGNEDVLEIAQGWDNNAIPMKNDRDGWEDVLIGCINEYAILESGVDFKRILGQLVPHSNSTLEERQKAYLNLNLKDKIQIFELLVHQVNESASIKEYMEECQEQLTELRKLKIELSRERKRIFAERLELEKRAEENTPDSHASESEADLDVSDTDSVDLDRAQRQVEEASRHESRQEVLKRKQAERDEREAKRIKMHHRRREEARARNQELKARAIARRRLDEDERHLHKKEEQVERDMRKYTTLRIKPLGRDKFYNRYYYMDNIGGASAHGTGKLFIQSPSEIDLLLLMERDEPKTVDALDTGVPNTNGGLDFVCRLMKQQGLEDESEFLMRRIEELKARPLFSSSSDWWEFYSEPEDLEKLLDWLNPKGIREYRLKRELEKHVHSLTIGMKKRATEQNPTRAEVPRRSTRSKAMPQVAPGSWLAYTNKYAR